ncbi:MAG: glycosyltransferase family 4 protein [Thermoprotei archaeon]
MVLEVTLVSPRSSVNQGFFRMGAALRARNPPPGVKYTYKQSGMNVSPRLDRYQVSPETLAYWLGSALLEHLKTRAGGLIHSFYWGYFNAWRPWIHDNDSSVSQYLVEYFNYDKITTKVVKIVSKILNAESCRRVVVWSEWAKQGMINDGVRDDKLVVIPPPIEPKRITKTNNVGKPVVAFIGRDYERKRGWMVLEAFKRLRNITPFRLIYVGEIPDKGVKAYVDGNPDITHYPFLPNKFIHEKVYPKADIVVLPTKADTFPVTILEAMSYGIPVVASNLPIIREQLGASSDNCTFSMESLEEFIEKLRSMLEDEKRRRIIGEALIKRVEEYYSPKAVNPKLLEVYRQAA